MIKRQLHITSPFMRGTDVLELQRELREFGLRPGISDGQYGPRTFQAVKEFQHKHRINSDGIVGPKTWAALSNPKIDKLPVPSPQKPTTRPNKSHIWPGLLALEEAVKHIGLKESPSGSNRQMFGAWIGANGSPWCNDFVSFCIYIGTKGKYVICKGFHGPGVLSKGCAYVPTTEAWFKSKPGNAKWLVRPSNNSELKDGDIPCYNWDGGVPDHIGFFAKEATLRRLVPHLMDAAIAKYGPLRNPTEFWAVEGNTGDTNYSNGGEVMICQRALNLVDGFGRLL